MSAFFQFVICAAKATDEPSVTDVVGGTNGRLFSMILCQQLVLHSNWRLQNLLREVKKEWVVRVFAAHCDRTFQLEWVLAERTGG